MSRWLLFPAFAVFTALLLGAAALGAAYLYLEPKLPPIDGLEAAELHLPLRIYSRDGELMAEYGEQRREPVDMEAVPGALRLAILAAEDDRFYEHPGVDYAGLLRAAWVLVSTGERRQGGSTITMQVARNFYLTSAKTFERKLLEILLALRIERELSKAEILELYINKVFLGHRAYGFGAAAQVYYGVPLDELDLAQSAMLAGLPKAPSRDNPLTAPDAARERRDYVLRRMHDLGWIETAAFEQAVAAPVSARRRQVVVDLDAPYVAELVRQWVVDAYGERAYTDGLSVYATVDAATQRAAIAALRYGIEAYDARHGYRGAESRVQDSVLASQAEMDAALRRARRIGELRPALVTRADGRLYLGDGESITLAQSSFGGRPVQLETGQLVRVRRGDNGQWSLAQLPGVQAALVALDPRNGELRALVGGYDFAASSFNRAVQAERQPGSTFKPFLYSAALDNGYTAASVINDAPVVLPTRSLGRSWRPQNSSRRFYGPTRLREALVNSRNLVSVRLLYAIGVDRVRRYCLRFGFDPERLPDDLSLALGSGTTSPLELARAFAVFANQGYRVDSHLVHRVVDRQDHTVRRLGPVELCDVDCDDARASSLAAGQADDADVRVVPRVAPRVITQSNAYIVDSMLRDVIQRGTARRARALERADLAGKTGTTNDLKDGWFAGYSSNLVTTVWMGFDQPRSLGRGEAGSRTALPIWMHFMRSALAGQPERLRDRPAAVVTRRVDAESGLLVDGRREGTVNEIFDADRLPETADARPGSADEGHLRSDIF